MYQIVGLFYFNLAFHYMEFFIWNFFNKNISEIIIITKKSHWVAVNFAHIILAW